MLGIHKLLKLHAASIMKSDDRDSRRRESATRWYAYNHYAVA